MNSIAGWCLLDLAPFTHMMEQRNRAKLRWQQSHLMVLLTLSTLVYHLYLYMPIIATRYMNICKTSDPLFKQSHSYLFSFIYVPLYLISYSYFYSYSHIIHSNCTFEMGVGIGYKLCFPSNLKCSLCNHHLRLGKRNL